MLADIEHELIDRIAGCWAGFLQVIQGPEAALDLAEVRHHLLALEQMVMSQAAARAHPDKFRLLGGAVAGEPGHHEHPTPHESPLSGPESSS